MRGLQLDSVVIRILPMEGSGRLVGREKAVFDV